MKLADTIRSMGILEEASEVGGGATGISQVAEPTGGKAKAPGNSKDAGEKGIINPVAGDKEETNPENNTAPTNVSADANRATIKSKLGVAGMGESISQLFDGEELSEGFREKAGTIFEAAVSERLAAITEDLEAQYNTTLAEEVSKLEEQTEIEIEKLVEQLDSYLSYASKVWLENNEIAVQSALRTEFAESFIEKLRDVFEEHYIAIPEEKIDVVEELAKKNEELEARLNEALNVNIALNKTIEESSTQKVFNQIAEGLALTDVERLRDLTEGVEYDSIETYEKKVKIIKENFLDKNKGKKSTGILEESFEPDEKTTPAVLEPQIAAYVNAITHNVKNR